MWAVVFCCCFCSFLVRGDRGVRFYGVLFCLGIFFCKGTKCRLVLLCFTVLNIIFKVRHCHGTTGMYN